MQNEQKGALLYLHALTSLHPGSGHALGVVDLPVQRERHTQWPVIPGSSLKGVLRDACRRKLAVGNGGSRKEADEDGDLVAVFGSPSGGDLKAGALAVTDCRLLAYPVRSVKGVFAWVTCPEALSRFSRDLQLAGQTGVGGVEKLRGELGNADDNRALCHSGALVIPNENALVLEEYDFNRQGVVPLEIVEAVKKAVHPDAQGQLESRLVVLHDDHFTHFVRHATEVSARIGLDYETKTVKQGALFYQEFLPAETIFYSVLLAAPPRTETKGLKAAGDVLPWVGERLGDYLQIGGDETIGKGICHVGKEALRG